MSGKADKPSRLKESDNAWFEGKPPVYWVFDGVHPTIADHALVADTWLEAIRKAK